MHQLAILGGQEVRKLSRIAVPSKPRKEKCCYSWSKMQNDSLDSFEYRWHWVWHFLSSSPQIADDTGLQASSSAWKAVFYWPWYHQDNERARKETPEKSKWKLLAVLLIGMTNSFWSISCNGMVQVAVSTVLFFSDFADANHTFKFAKQKGVF